VRLVADRVDVNGTPWRLEDVLADHDLAPLLSREGPLQHLTERIAALAAPALWSSHDPAAAAPAVTTLLPIPKTMQPPL
jgi:hypothetical protein